MYHLGFLQYYYDMDYGYQNYKKVTMDENNFEIENKIYKI